jgi:hypothetical protein
MDWLKSGISTLSGFFFDAAPMAPEPSRIERADAIRLAMLDALGDDGTARHSRLALKIRNCLHAHKLWDLRPDLMNAVSVMYGESSARERMEAVDAHFVGAVPAAWTIVAPRHARHLPRHVAHAGR